MMNHKQLMCDPERIELFLRQQLSGEEQADFETHLDECDDCCQRLEQAAAADDVRDAIRESLRTEEVWLDADDLGDDSAGNDDRPSFSIDRVRDLFAPTDDDRMMGRLGGYEVVGIIGTGGMGIVVKAFDPALNRYVAIKILSPHLGSSGAARKRFSREAQAAAAVVHDNVIEIHGVADARGLPYLVMPYVRGPSLQKRLDESGPLSVVEILRIARQTAAGLAAAHAQGIVHRDIKPANILLAEGVDRVKLTDFGLARAADDASLTRTGVIAGTPQYMSPEQAQGELVDQRSDLFSLGSVMYVMCTGRPPFRAETSYGILRRITDTQPRPIRDINPEIPEWLCAVVDRLMSKRPDDRCGSAEEVAELLEDCLAHVQQPTTVPLPWRKLPACEPARQSGNSPRGAPSASRTAVLRVLIGAALAFALLVAGVVIVLENGKGTLTIESEAGVPIRIMKANEVAKELTVTPGTNSVRIRAGHYVVAIVGQHDGLQIERDGVVTVTRGEKRLVRISQRKGIESELQGSWKVIEMSRGGKVAPTQVLDAAGFLIDSEALVPTVNGTARVDDALVYALFESASPKRIDLTEVDSGETSLGIYDLVGDRLRICFAGPGNERPSSFDSTTDNVTLLLLERRTPAATSGELGLNQAPPMARQNEPGIGDARRDNHPAEDQVVGQDPALTSPIFDAEESAKFRSTIAEYFIADMRDRVRELDEIKAKVAETEASLQKRLDAQQESIDLQMKRFLQEAVQLAADSNERLRPAMPAVADRSSVTPGIRVRLPLSKETYSREMMEQYRHVLGISVYGVEMRGFVGVVSQGCVLEHFEETDRAGSKYWEATLFVPQSPASSLANRSLTQRRLDDLREQGVEFQLEVRVVPATIATGSADDRAPGTHRATTPRAPVVDGGLQGTGALLPQESLGIPYAAGGGAAENRIHRMIRESPFAEGTWRAVEEFLKSERDMPDREAEELAERMRQTRLQEADVRAKAKEIESESLPKPLELPMQMDATRANRAESRHGSLHRFRPKRRETRPP